MKTKFKNFDRAWINQPSALQPDHKKHQMRVIVGGNAFKAEANGQIYRDVCFADNIPKISMRISELSLSLGWPKEVS